MTLFRNVFKISLVPQLFCAYGKRSYAGNNAMRVLNVAEKNDAAKHISGQLSNGNTFKREGLSKYNKIYEFNYNLFGQHVKMVMTSVSGHLFTHEFVGNYSKWTGCSPDALFEAPVVKMCPENSKLVKESLEKEIRTCEALIIWTDCDREGENIGFEIISVCTSIKPNIPVYRAKFSEITKQSVTRAVDNLEQPNPNLDAAVNVRSELDLRIGAAFTRFQTLRLQKVFPEILQKCLISYGSCQFPTLGFVVERFKAVDNFVPERFWKIKVTHTIGELTVEFNWQRVRLFDKEFCEVIYEKCKENSLAKVESIITKPKYKYRPIPLDTVELEKIASRKLKISAKETMRLAERLYNQGLISYPRTETNSFPKSMNLPALVEMQANDGRWGEFAVKVLQAGVSPRQGKKSDQAHPPIHPTKYTNALSGNELRLYEYIVRHFLACLSENARGLETNVTIDINEEKFVANGLIIEDMGYLEVYPYDKWNSKEIHGYTDSQTFQPTTVEMVEGQTSPPNLLTEADLISLMEKHGIGTDATHAEHIETVKRRMYVGLIDDKYFTPGELGMALVEGYDSMGFEMSKPHLRAELEEDLKKICDGQKDPREVLTSQVQKYHEVFRKSVEQANKLDLALSKYLKTAITPVPNNFDSIVGGLPKKVLQCSKCGLPMVLKHRQNNPSFISCTGFPECKNAIWLPNKVLEVELSENTCPQCGPGVNLLKFKFRPGSMTPYYPNEHVGCVGGCDQELLNLLEIRPRPDGGNAANAGANARRPPSPRNYQARNNFQNRNPNDDTGYFSASGSNTQASYRGRSNYNAPPANPPTNDDDIQCNCGESAKKLTVNKEGANKGRQFYACSKPQNDPNRCNFFMWASNAADGPEAGEPARGGGSNFRRSNYGGGGGQGGSNYQRRNDFRGRKKQFNSASGAGAGTTARKCGLCKQEGHYRQNCPMNPYRA